MKQHTGDVALIKIKLCALLSNRLARDMFVLVEFDHYCMLLQPQLYSQALWMKKQAKDLLVLLLYSGQGMLTPNNPVMSLVIRGCCSIKEYFFLGC